MKISLAFCMLILAAGTLSGQPSALEKGIVIDPARNYLDVYVPPPSLEGWNDKAKWLIVAIDSANSVTQVDIAGFQAAGDNSLFTIIPRSPPQIASATRVIVKFGDNLVLLPPRIRKPPTSPVVAPESNKQKADLYINGSYSPRIKSDPQYSVDGSIALMFDVSNQHIDWGQVGLVGSVKADKRKKANLESLRLFFAYQKVLESKPAGRLQGVLFTWLPAGVELDLKGRNRNLISSPSLDFPIRLFPKITRAGTLPLARIVPSLGVETGWSFKDSISARGHRIFRGVLGADLLFRTKSPIPQFKSIEFTSNYTLRTPVQNEIFTLVQRVNDKDVDRPILNRKPRHYVKSELGFKLNDHLSFSVKHEFGMVPPVFRRTENKVTIGFTFSSRQTQDGVPTAIRNK